MAVKVKVLISFTSFGVDFNAGQIVDPEELSGMDANAMANRFKNGFLGYDVPEAVLEDEEDQVEAPSEIVVTSPTGESETIPNPTSGAGRSFTLPE